MVKIMIDSVDQNPAPKRIALGSDAYTIIHKHKALTERLAAPEAQKDLVTRPTCPTTPNEERRLHAYRFGIAYRFRRLLACFFSLTA
jgi:hypothetical protein